MTKCDYCKKTAYWLIFACKDHLKALDKNHSRKESHSIDYGYMRKLEASEKLVQKLQAELEVLKEESKKPKRVEVKPYDKGKTPFVEKADEP